MCGWLVCPRWCYVVRRRPATGEGTDDVNEWPHAGCELPQCLLQPTLSLRKHSQEHFTRSRYGSPHGDLSHRRLSAVVRPDAKPKPPASWTVIQPFHLRPKCVLGGREECGRDHRRTPWARAHQRGRAHPRAPGGQSPPRRPHSREPGGGGCDPRSPRRATATRPGRPPRTGPGCCDPRSPRRATATRGHQIWVTTGIPVAILGAPEGNRHSCWSAVAVDQHRVAILGRPGGQPPREQGCRAARVRGVAILGRPGGQPPQVVGVRVPHPCVVAIPGRPGGQPPPYRSHRRGLSQASCDPRSPRRATATWRAVRLWRAGPRGCDPRSPRRATATRSMQTMPSPFKTLRSSVAPEGNRHRGRPPLLRIPVGVAILGRPGGQPPR